MDNNGKQEILLQGQFSYESIKEMVKFFTARGFSVTVVPSGVKGWELKAYNAHIDREKLKKTAEIIKNNGLKSLSNRLHPDPCKV